MKKMVTSAVVSVLALGLSAGSVHAQSDNASDKNQGMASMDTQSEKAEFGTLLNTTTTTLGQKLAYPDISQARVVVRRIKIPTGGKTKPHAHPVPLMGHFEQGTLKVKYSQGETRKFKEGDTAMQALSRCHTGQAVGSEDVVLLAAFIMSEDTKGAVPCEG